MGQDVRVRPRADIADDGGESFVGMMGGGLQRLFSLRRTVDSQSAASVRPLTRSEVTIAQIVDLPHHAGALARSPRSGRQDGPAAIHV